MEGFYILRSGELEDALLSCYRRVAMHVWSGVSGDLASGVHYGKVKEAFGAKGAQRSCVSI